MRLTIFDSFIDWWLRQCDHDGLYVTFDLLERDIEGVENVRFCNRCGAVRVGRQKEWRRPQPLHNR